MSAAPAFPLNRPSYPASSLIGKNPIPVIDRDPDPGNQLTQRAALLEAFLAAISNSETQNAASLGLGELVEKYAHLFSDKESVSRAIATRNNVSHARSRPVTIDAKRKAAEALAVAIEDVMPQVPREMREYASTDPHAPIPSETLAEILQSTANDICARVQKLACRLNALLALFDQQGCRPPYDLAPGQAVASLKQRLHSNQKRFGPIEFYGLLYAADMAAKIDGEISPDRRRHMTKKLLKIAEVLEIAVGAAESELGIRSVPPAAAQVIQMIAQPEKEEPAQDITPVEPEPVAVPPAPVEVPPMAPRHAVRAIRTLIVATGGVWGLVAAKVSASVQANAEPERPVLVRWSIAPLTDAGRRAGFSEKVLVNVWINEQGVPVRLEVRRAVGYGLEEKAIDTVRQWRFAISRGKSTELPFVVEVEFDHERDF